MSKIVSPAVETSPASSSLLDVPTFKVGDVYCDYGVIIDTVAISNYAAIVVDLTWTYQCFTHVVLVLDHYGNEVGLTYHLCESDAKQDMCGYLSRTAFLVGSR